MVAVSKFNLIFFSFQWHAVFNFDCESWRWKFIQYLIEIGVLLGKVVEGTNFY